MAVTSIDIEVTTGQDVFTSDQSSPPLTEEQARIVAERFMELLQARMEEAYPNAAVSVVGGNSLGGGTRIEASSYQEEDVAKAHLQSVAEELWASNAVWGVVA